MDKIWLEYVSARTPDGMGQDHEHVKYYWGPENDWKCEVPVAFAGMLIENMGVDKFMPCLAPGEADAHKVSELKDAQEELAQGQKDLAMRVRYAF